VATKPHYTALGDAIEARITELYGDQDDRYSSFADAAEIGTTTLRKMRRGEDRTRGYELHIVLGVERAAGWAPGSFDAVLAGGEPAPLEPSPADEGRPERTPTVSQLLNVGAYNAATLGKLLELVVQLGADLTALRQELAVRRAEASVAEEVFDLAP
jgi:hypothetical protein